MIRDQVLFTPDGKASRLLSARWSAEGGAYPLSQQIALLNPDRSAAPVFRLAWQRSFPTRSPLPMGPVATEEGKGTTEFWDRFE